MYVMIGIIYKFTILTNRRFYVGQHEAESVDEFLISKPSLSSCYWGSGSAIWEHVLKKHIDKYPTNWNKLIKREILLVMNSYSPKSLNIMERYWIKEAKAHYSFKVGGCNFLSILWTFSIYVPLINAYQNERSSFLFEHRQFSSYVLRFTCSHSSA